MSTTKGVMIPPIFYGGVTSRETPDSSANLGPYVELAIQQMLFVASSTATDRFAAAGDIRGVSDETAGKRQGAKAAEPA